MKLTALSLKIAKQYTKLILVIIVITALGLTFIPSIPVEPVQAATLEQQLDAIQKKLAEIAKQKQKIQSTINSYGAESKSYDAQLSVLSAEISLIDIEISEKQAQIDELNLKIKQLNEEIETSNSVISQTEYDIVMMNEKVQLQLKKMYVDYKTGIGTPELDAAIDAEGLFKTLQYKNLLVQQINSLIGMLDDTIDSLEAQKTVLEGKKVQVANDKSQVDKDKKTLDGKRSEIDRERRRYYNLQYQAWLSGESAKGDLKVLDEAEQQSRAKAELIKQTLFNNVGSIKNGSFVKAGTIIGYQGKTGIATGPHLHFSAKKDGKSINPCTVLVRGPFANCAGSGAMNSWPLRGTHYYTSSYGNRCYDHNGTKRCNFHDGIDIAHPTANAPIYAAHDGWLTKGFDPCSWSSLCNNGGANYIVICENKDNCNKGLKSGYWHLSAFT